jgi:hypothetical protein
MNVREEEEEEEEEEKEDKNTSRSTLMKIQEPTTYILTLPQQHICKGGDETYRPPHSSTLNSHQARHDLT